MRLYNAYGTPCSVCGQPAHLWSPGVVILHRRYPCWLITPDDKQAGIWDEYIRRQASDPARTQGPNQGSRSRVVIRIPVHAGRR